MTDNNNLPSFDPNNMNFDELMSQAQEMQDKMKNAQDAIINLKVVGQAGEGTKTVQVIMGGNHSVMRVIISDDLKSGDKEILEDTVAAACNKAVSEIEKKTQEKMLEFAQSLKLPPGFKMPF